MRKYSIKKNFYVNQKEDDLLKAKSEKAGICESDFLRRCTEGYKIKEQPNEVINNFLDQINGIANNINQIAKKLNAYGYIQDKDFEYVKKELSKFILEFKNKFYSRGDDFSGSNKD